MGGAGLGVGANKCLRLRWHSASGVEHTHTDGCLGKYDYAGHCHHLCQPARALIHTIIMTSDITITMNIIIVISTIIIMNMRS